MPRKPYSFAITVTLKPEYHSCTPETQFLHFRNKIHNILYPLAKSYVFFPELTKKGNIHFHGTITVTSRGKLFNIMKIFDSVIGHSWHRGEPDDGWGVYMTKNMVATQKALQLMNIKFEKPNDIQQIEPPQALEFRQDYIDKMESKIKFIDED